MRWSPGWTGSAPSRERHDFPGMGGDTIAAPPGAVGQATDDRDDDCFLVVTADQKTLQGAPAFQRPSLRAKERAMNNIITNSGTNASDFAYEGYTRADHHALTAGDLESARVYGRGDDSIGSISKLVVTKDGEITHAVIDVGGFLGMGARSVSMPFADLTVLRETGGDDVRIYVDASKEKLEAMPRYEG